jgi:hypothetical protein
MSPRNSEIYDNTTDAIARETIENEKLHRELTSARTPGLFTIRASREREIARVEPLVMMSDNRLRNLVSIRSALEHGFSDDVDWHRKHVDKNVKIWNNNREEDLGKLVSISSRGGGGGWGTGGTLLGDLVYRFLKDGTPTEKVISLDDYQDRRITGIFLKFHNSPLPSAPPALPPRSDDPQGGGARGRRSTRRRKHIRRKATRHHRRRT